MCVTQHRKDKYVVVCGRTDLSCWEHVLHISPRVDNIAVVVVCRINARLFAYHVPLVRGH